MVEDYGEFMANKAAEDPLWVECPTCGGDGVVFSIAGKGHPKCTHCGGRGDIRNPQLET